MSVTIHVGDVLDALDLLPDESVHCVVTSPPYWGLRDYGVEGQMGTEPTPEEHVTALVKVFREVRRVLRKDGTLWLNYGDCYATQVNGRDASDARLKASDDRVFRNKPFSTCPPRVGTSGSKGNSAADRDGPNRTTPPAWYGLKPKDLVGMPWRVAFALQQDGWWLRQDIIWHKPNPMPESIRDRCTKAHEYLFLLAKSERYYFDSEAMKEPSVYAGKQKSERDFNGKRKGTTLGQPFRHVTPTRNRRSVWTIATRPFKGAHFATFPPNLIEPCILAGCLVGGTVLDPFGGSGTTGMVAQKHGRNAILIELNPDYAAMARQRCAA